MSMFHRLAERGTTIVVATQNDALGREYPALAMELMQGYLVQEG